MGLKKIAQFLGFSLNEEEIQSIVDKSTFTAMKQKASETHGAFGDILFRKGTFQWGKEFICIFQSDHYIPCEPDLMHERCIIEYYAPDPCGQSPRLQHIPALFWGRAGCRQSLSHLFAENVLSQPSPSPLLLSDCKVKVWPVLLSYLFLLFYCGFN